MNTLLVGYDLNKSGQNYKDLIDHLETFETRWHYLDSTWFLKTSQSASELRDALKQIVDSNDEVLVMNVTGDNWASYGLSTAATNWLHNNL